MSPSPALRRPLALLTALVTTAAAALVAAPAVQALAPDQPVLAGSLQDELGCAADWMPDCEATALVLDAATGKHTFTTDALPRGTYEVKVAVGGS